MKINNHFLVGIAVGIGIGYYLASEDKEELIERVKDKASQARDMVEDGIERGKKLVENIRAKSRNAVDE